MKWAYSALVEKGGQTERTPSQERSQGEREERQTAGCLVEENGERKGKAFKTGIL